MVSEGKGRLFRRVDDKYLVYVPKDLGKDSMFPFPLTKEDHSVAVKVSFKIGEKKLTVEKWEKEGARP